MTCFQCNGGIDSSSNIRLTDDVNIYNFCSSECEVEFINEVTYDNDGILSSYKGI